MSWHPNLPCTHTQSRRKTKQPGRMPVLAPPCLLRTACAFVHLTVPAQVWATLEPLVLTCTLAVDRHPSPQAFSSSDPSPEHPYHTHTRQCSLILGGKGDGGCTEYCQLPGRAHQSCQPAWREVVEGFDEGGHVIPQTKQMDHNAYRKLCGLL